MNKNRGQVFTEQNITNFMLELANSYFSSDTSIKVLEPSFGDGIFIKSLLEKNKKIILSGIEIEKDFLKKTLGNISSYHIEKSNNEEKNNGMGIYTNNKNIELINGNYFDSIDLLKNTKNGFDLIIGNPPYVKNNNIEEETKRLLDITYKKEKDIGIINNSWNLYYYFIYDSINKLKEGGKLIFITPITFLTNTYAKGLRDFLYNNGDFLEIYSLEEEKIFQDADIETIIFVYQKKIKENKEKNKNIKIGIVKDKLNKNIPITKNNFKISYIENFGLNDFYWNIYNDTSKDFLYKQPITDIFHICVGMVSGLDNAFLIKDIENLKLNNKEKENIIYIVKNEDLAKNKKGTTFGKPYIFINTGLINSEEELKKDLPNFYNQLSLYKEKLKKRYGKKNLKYWEWATVRNKTFFEEKKSMYCIPSITRQNNCSFIKVENQEKPLYGGGNIISLIFKKNISKEEQEKYEKIIKSQEYIKYINKEVIKKGGRKMFSQKFISTLKV